MQKKEAMRKLRKALTEDSVDDKIKPILTKINSSKNWHTTSSCAGRIHIYEIAEPGAKETLNHLGKWHDKVDFEDFRNTISSHRNNQLWLKVSPPILHVGCTDLKSAERLLKKAYASGFKYSSIKNIDPPMVEITTTGSMEVLLGQNGSIEVSFSYLEHLVQLSNQKLERFQAKLARLLQNL